jgi:hypothetical protein
LTSRQNFALWPKLWNASRGLLNLRSRSQFRASTSAVFFGQGPSWKVSTTSPSRRKVVAPEMLETEARAKLDHRLGPGEDPRGMACVLNKQVRRSLQGFSLTSGPAREPIVYPKTGWM